MPVNIYKFIILLCIVSTVSQAQCLKGITTNPDNPINNERPDKKNTFFDWRNSLYSVNSQYITTTQIESPFSQSNNLQVNHFLNNQDRLPEDGWELIKYDLGFNENGTPKTTPVGYVHLVLYNKYTGILRAFVAGDRPQAFNGAKMEIKYSSGIISSALSNSSTLFALDKFEATPSITSVAEYNNNNGRWFYSDFQIGYDPCTCLYESSMVIQIRLINNSVINLSGSITGELTSIANGAGTVLENSYSFNAKDLVTAGKKAQKSYKDVQKFVSDQEKALKIDGKTDQQLLPEQLIKRNDLKVFQEALKNNSFLKAGLKAAPYVAGALELVNFFIGGGQKSSGPQEVKISPMALNADISLKGTLEASYLYGDITFYTPGSKNSQTKNPADYAYYNEVLGIFNLLSSLEIKGERSVSGNIYTNPTYTDRYKLVSNIKYVLNPAAGFKPDKVEILGNLVFDDSEYRLSPIQTGYLPIAALSDLFVQYSALSSDSPSPIPSGNGAKLNLLINLERSDSDPNTQNVVLALSFPVKWSLVVLPLGSPLTISGTQAFIDSPATYSTVIQNQTITKWNSITLLPGATMLPTSNIKLDASKFNTYTSYPSPASQADINTFCNSTSYIQAPGRNLKTREEELTVEEDFHNEYNFLAFPNPGKHEVTFQYYLEKAEMVDLSILDLSGRLISTIVSEYKDKGIQKVIFNAS